MFNSSSSGSGGGSSGLGDPTFGWAYQDFASITGTSVTLTANDNGTSAPFSVPDIISSSAFIVRTADTDTVPYTGVTKLFSSRVSVTAHTADAITLSGIPDASWGSLRIYYLYQYSTFPVNYTLAPKFIRHSVLSEIDALFITHEELLSANIGTSGTGPFASYSGTTAQFYKLNSLSASLTIALDAINNKIDFTSTALVSPLTTRGDLLGMNPSGTHIRIPIGAANRLLRSDGTDASWAQAVLTTDVTGTLPIANGGTSATSFTEGQVVFPGTAGTPLTGSSNFYWDNAAGSLHIGPNDPMIVHGSAIDAQLEINSDTLGTVEIHSHSAAAAAGATIYGARSRGTTAAPTVVASGDFARIDAAVAYDGTDYETLGYTIWAVDGTPGANDMPGRWMLYTTADGAFTPTERLRVASTGAWGLAGANYGTSGQVLTSAGSASPPTWSTITGSGIDHGLLTGLADDDHAQYFLLAGRNPSQVAIGSTALGGSLTLQSTSHGTKGKIFLGIAQTSAFMETVDRLGLKTNSPSATIHINGTSDEVQSIFEAHSTQTTNLTEWHSSASAVLARVTGEGRIGHASGSGLTTLGLFFNADTDCGWYLNAADDIVLSVGGQSFMQFDENGATSDVTVNSGQSQHRWKWLSANDGVGNFYIDGGGDRAYFGLGETPSLVGTAYKLTIQVGNIRDNFGALQLYHSPTNSTASIVAPTYFSQFYFEQDTAAAKTLTNSDWEHVYSAVTDNAGATLTLGTTGNKSMYELTFNPTQTSGTLTYTDFRAIQYQRNLNGAGVTEQWDVNQVGITRNRYCGIAPIVNTLAPAADMFTVAFGANQASPDTNYSVQLTGRWTPYTLLALGKPFPGTGWIYVKAVLYGASKATTGFTGYVEYQVIDGTTNVLYTSVNNHTVLESEILAHHPGADTVVYTDTSFTYVDWLVRRYY